MLNGYTLVQATVLTLIARCGSHQVLALTEYLKQAQPFVQAGSEQQLARRVKLNRLHHRLAGLLLVGVLQPGGLY